MNTSEEEDSVKMERFMKREINQAHTSLPSNEGIEILEFNLPVWFYVGICLGAMITLFVFALLLGLLYYFQDCPDN